VKQGLRVALLLGLLSGCTTTPPTIGDPAPQLADRRKEQAYQDILEKFSDRAEVYDGFESRVEELLAAERAEDTQFNEFHMGVHVNDPKFEDFAFPRTSIWRIVLLTPVGEVEPVSVERIGRSTLDMRAFYPYLGVFWVAYKVRFPKVLKDGTPIIPPSASHVTLRLASALGHAELRVHAH
jgi:hypothetical protein